MRTVPALAAAATLATLVAVPAGGAGPSSASSVSSASSPSSVRPAAYAGDFDGDGRSDIYHPGAGRALERVSFGAPDATLAVEDIVLGGTYRPFTGDFDGDGRDDVFHYGPGTAPDLLWYGGADRGLTSVPTSVRGTYAPAVGDFDGDGRSDILWYGRGRAPDYVWYGRASRKFGQTAVRVDFASAVTAVGDFDGDGRSDIRWHTGSSRDEAVWYGATGARFEKVPAASLGRGFTPVVGDFDGEGTDDVLWYGSEFSTVYLSSRVRGGPGRTIDVSLPAGGALSVGDFNGDLSADVLVTGKEAAVAYGSAAGLLTATTVTPPRGQSPVVADVDGDLDSDVYWTGAGRDTLWRGLPTRSFASGGVATRPNRVPALDPAVWATQYEPYGYVAHAMGGVNGQAYTNSLEAFHQNYAAGFRVFEVDFVLLKDGNIVALHDGTERALGLTKHYRDTTYAELRGRKINGKYTVLTGADVIRLMRKHRDVYIVLDPKWARTDIMRRLLAAAAPDPQVVRRVLPHIAGQDDLDTVRRTYPLQHYVVALYRTQVYGRFDDPEVLAFVRRNKAPAVMMWIGDRDRSKSLSWNGKNGRRYEAAFAASIQQAGAVAYVHSTRDGEQMRPFAQQRIGVYSDGPLGPEGPVGLPSLPDPLAALLGEHVA